ncbi:MAG: AAA domain-containing protein [Candidatus Altimarinota bacterium]
MLPVAAIFAGVAIAATALSWLYDSKTEEEKERQEELKRKLSELKNKFDLELECYNQNLDDIARNNYNKIKDMFLNEVKFFKDEKKTIKKDLDKLASSIQKELENEAISPYQKQSLLDNRNKVEDAKNRLDAYWLYLDWFEKKLDELAQYKKYQDIFDLEMPQALLPEEYLYLGKLAYILKNKDEIATNGDKSTGWNKYDQKLSLNDYFNKKELELLESYNQDVEFMILIDHTKDNKHFNASVIKGELYQYILEDMSFEVQPKFNENQNQEKLTLLYNDVYLNLKRDDKLYPLKQYKEYDSFEVKVKEYDLLLKNVFVTEKLSENSQETSNNSIPIIFNNLSIEIIEELDTILQNNNFQGLNYKDNNLTLKIDNYILSLEVNENENLLILKEILEIDINQTTSNSFTVPYEFVLIDEVIYNQTYKNLSLNNASLFSEFLSFTNEQLNYISYSAKTSNKDFDFFKKWQKIVDYQIEDNSFDTIDVSYYKFKIDNKLIIFYVSNLKEHNKNFKDKKSRDIFIEINGINLGYLDDYSVEENILKIRIDFLDNLVIEKEGKLSIKVKNYQAVLQKQKKALKDFSFSKIVNQDLKQLLISPTLINYKPITNNFKLDFKNKNLTKNQQDIINKAFNEKNIFLVQGPPGTGKTTIIKELIYQTIKQDQYTKVLIVSQQNVAVDNVLDGIDRENAEWFEKEGHSIVRVAPNEDKIQYDNIKEFTVEKWFEKYKKTVKDNFIKIEQNKDTGNSLLYGLHLFSEFKNEKILNQNLFNYALEWMNLIYKPDFKDIDNEIKELLISKHQILGATCVGLANKLLGLDLIEFDVVIIDEAGRATAPELLIPVLRAKKVILIGDHNQLPPTIDRKLLQKLESDDEEDLSFEDLEILRKSFFEELFEKVSNSNKAMLNEQFRMPKEIGNLISNLFYDNKLNNGHIKDTNDFLDPKTIIRWVDVDGEHNTDGTSSYNNSEIDKIINLLETINKYLEKETLNKTIGIITPYSAQKRRIRKKVESLELSNILNLKVDTVDSFQGEEADIIIYSTVKTYGNISFLIDRKRLNVAISRTKENLFFIGKKDFFYSAKTNKDEINLFKKIIDFTN